MTLQNCLSFACVQFVRKVKLNKFIIKVKTMSSGVKKITELIKDREFTYSFEVTPDIALEKVDKLSVDPIFFSITWHAKQHHCKDLDIPPLKLARYLRSKNKNVMLHLSCDLMTKKYLIDLLDVLRSIGVCNLLVVLGESFNPNGSEFQSTKELIKNIRQHYEDYFCIGVPGFPEESERKFLHLKEKIDAGADFIFTQALFEPQVYESFVSKCNSLGIKVPIIPGVFCCETYKELTSFIDMCKVKVSKNLLNNIQDNAEQNSCVKTLVRDMVNSKVGSNHIHFYTLNKLENVAKFIKELN